MNEDQTLTFFTGSAPDIKSIGKNDSNREMNLRAKPNVMNPLINYRACDKMKGHYNVTRMVITKARAMTFGLGGKLKLLFIRNALFSLFKLLETAQVWNRATTVSGILTGPPVGM